MFPYTEEEEAELLLGLLLSVDASYDTFPHRHGDGASLITRLLREYTLSFHFESRYEVIYGGDDREPLSNKLCVELPGERVLATRVGPQLVTLE